MLARNKKASVGDLRYYADTQLEAFSSPMAVAQLAASLALYGDAQRSEATFTAALQLAKSTTEYDWYRSDYGSPLRDGAAMLALAAESRPVPSVVPELIQLVSAERAATRWTSTQDDAWMLLAARALQAGNAAISARPSTAQPYTGAFSKTVTGEELLDQPDRRSPMPAQTPSQAVVTTVAAPAQPLPAGGDGFTIERTYYRLDGSEANVTEATQNERFVVVLKVTRAATTGRRACWSTTCCRPASRSTIRAWSPAPTWRISPGCSRPRRRISSSATTASSRPSTAMPAPTATSRSPMWCAR